MKEQSDNNVTFHHEDYLVASLIDYFREPKAARNFLHAAKLAHSVLTRDSAPKAAALDKRFLFLASKLKDNIAPSTLRDFAKSCFAAAKRDSDPVLSSTTPTKRTLLKRAKEDLAQSLQSGYSEGAAINRAAYELIKKRKEEQAKQKLAKTIQIHPMRDTLLGLVTQNGRLANEDIRNQLLQLKRRRTDKNSGGGILFGLLERAQAFSVPRLHRLLGDELFFLCRPCGFLDQKGGTVVVEVPTNAHLHALTYRKLEILRALRSDSAFVNVSRLHFKVVAANL